MPNFTVQVHDTGRVFEGVSISRIYAERQDDDERDILERMRPGDSFTRKGWTTITFTAEPESPEDAADLPPGVSAAHRFAHPFVCRRCGTDIDKGEAATTGLCCVCVSKA